MSEKEEINITIGKQNHETTAPEADAEAQRQGPQRTEAKSLAEMCTKANK